LTAPHSAPILSGMKVFFVALSIAVTLAGAAFAQTPADWRALASAYDIALIENWEKHFDRAIADTVRARPEGFHGITREELAGLKNASKIDAFPASWEGTRPCRTILSQSYVIIRYTWFDCRLTRDAGGWRIEKLTGSWLMEGRVYFDPELGSVYLGSARTPAEAPSWYGDGTDGDQAGVLRIAERHWLRLFMPGVHNFDFLEIDLQVKLHRRAP
jgi:Domain of unknown function (DUF4893)